MENLEQTSTLDMELDTTITEEDCAPGVFGDAVIVLPCVVGDIIRIEGFAKKFKVKAVQYFATEENSGLIINHDIPLTVQNWDRVKVVNDEPEEEDE